MIRSVRRTAPAVAVAAVLALTLGSCSFLGQVGTGGGGANREGEITVNALYAAGETGGVAQQTISIAPSDDGDVRIDFSENEVTGFGDMTRAASWNAVTVATLLTGAPLATQYRFAFDGAIDGPSAGGLTTVALLALYFGDDIAPDATMTGTINPTGTIGTVGGIPEKIQGVIDQGEITRVMIPAGQRNSPNARGELVDVVDLGAGSGVEVVEVATVYDAYLQLTGEELPRPEDDNDPRISETGYDKIASSTDDALARFDRAAAEYYGLDPSVRTTADALAAQAQANADRARDLQVQGLQAGAFVEAHAAAGDMTALFNTFDTVQSILVQGFGALDVKLAASQTAIDEFEAYLDSLGTYTPQNLTDVEALVTTYGNAFDSYSLLLFATGQLEALQANIEAGAYTSLEQLLNDIFTPLIFFEYARAQLEFAKATFDVGRDNDGGPVAAEADISAVGSFLRRGADANWAAFESGVIAPAAQGQGVSNDVFRDSLGAIDFSVALSYAGQIAQPQIEAYIGEADDNAAYATMGYGTVNYARNAILIEKYYNNGVLDENLNLVGVNSDTILTAALDLGRSQVARSINVLSGEGTTSVLSVGAFEQAGVAREGDVIEKFNAIGQYSSSFVLSRTLAFLGGYPTEGWSR